VIYTLQRTSQSTEGTFGTFYDPSGTILCYTAELPWDDNKPDSSCIPSGIYDVIPHNSPNHPDTWEIINVPDRSEILIHNGNFAGVNKSDTDGCILVGSSVGFIGEQQAVLNSNITFDKLRTILPSNFTLQINDEAQK
jgi:Family of unknown function (DUF5675)